jgi:hypothetical protein
MPLSLPAEPTRTTTCREMPGPFARTVTMSGSIAAMDTLVTPNRGSTEKLTGRDTAIAHFPSRHERAFEPSAAPGGAAVRVLAADADPAGDAALVGDSLEPARESPPVDAPQPVRT